VGVGVGIEVLGEVGHARFGRRCFGLSRHHSV
jgi:hypothetical protein